MSEQLEQLVQFTLVDGPAQFLDVAIEHDGDMGGWTCGFRQGDQWVLVVKLGATAEEAVRLCFEESKRLWQDVGGEASDFPDRFEQGRSSSA